MKLIEVTKRTDMTVYRLFIGLSVTIAHEQVISWNASNIWMFGIAELGFWFGTPKTQIHIFYSR